MALCALLAACASSPSGDRGDAGTKGGYYKVGQPYQINNQWYYPKEDYSYDETGVASWYGGNFHDQMTANGEIYNKDELTAAHKTLPLPSLARVTNLENGRSVVVRVNDRGPFSGARIIDVSQRSAGLLGFERQGTAKVRVQVLADESKAIADAMRHYGHPKEEGASSVEVASASTGVMSDSPTSTVAMGSEPSLLPASVEAKTLKPIQSTAETRRELLRTKPVPFAVQLPVTGSTRLYVQAGAFTIPENAKKLQKKLAHFGSAAISTSYVNGIKFYRVRLGPVANIPRADALLAEVRHAGVPEARTVVD